MDTINTRLLKRLIRTLERIEKQQVNTTSEKAQPTDKATNTQPTEIRLPPEISSYYRSEERERPRKNQWESRMRLIQFSGFLAAVILGILTYQTFKETRRQADAAQAQVREMKIDEDIQNRAWVKITPYVESALRFDVTDPDQKEPMARIKIRYVFENVGSSVAVNAIEQIDLVPMGLGALTGEEGLVRFQGNLCDAATKASKRISGHILFPHDPVNMTTTMGPGISEIERKIIPNMAPNIGGKAAFVLVGCVAYRSSFDSQNGPIHHTRFRYYLRLLDSSPFNLKSVYLTPRGIVPVELAATPDGFSAD